MPISEQSVLQYLGDNPGAGREDIRRHVAPGGQSTDGLARPEATGR